VLINGIPLLQQPLLLLLQQPLFPFIKINPNNNKIVVLFAKSKSFAFANSPINIKNKKSSDELFKKYIPPSIILIIFR